VPISAGMLRRLVGQVNATPGFPDRDGRFGRNRMIQLLFTAPDLV
jgi:hypothetical protein